MNNFLELQEITDLFTSLDESGDEERLLLEQVSTRVRKYKRALVIGRFQPLHRGHLYLIKAAAKLADEVVIGIGSSNVSNTDNPFSVLNRQEVLETVLKRENIASSVRKIVFLDDMPSDEDWFQQTLKKAGPFELVIGNNDWVNGIFKNHGIEALTLPFFKREIYEGRKIRDELRKTGRMK